MKKYLIIGLVLSVTVVLLAACTSTSGTASVSVPSGNSETTVHMGQTNFIQSGITISKGSSLTLVNDTSTVHIISNGSWLSNVAQPKQESEAPVVNAIQFSGSGQSQTIGPFTTAGTYHLYCKVHPNMNLIVTVQ